MYISTKIDKALGKITHQNKSHNIYASMARLSSNAEILWSNYGDSLQLKIWLLDSGVTCHMIPDFSNFIPSSLVETDKYIKVADDNFITV